MTSIVRYLGDRVIGTVESVSADRIEVLLDPEAPQATALNTGTPAAFPRINGYVLIPNESGAIIGVISSVRIERLPYPKRRGTQQDFGLVDLPFPARLMVLTPLGTLIARPKGDTADSIFQLRLEVKRGVDVFPSVGDPVILPTDEQLQAIVQGESPDTPGRILLGYCPTAGRAPVYVDPDKLFGRHLAILGNTGAGKSCSVAGLVRWSIEAAREARLAAAGSDSEGVKRGPHPNARFIILDPNGEYAEAFKDFDGLRLFQVQIGSEQGQSKPLKVPAWLWNGEEWAAFTEASFGVQRPILFKALRRLRGQMSEPDSFEARAAATINVYRNILRLAHASREYLRFPGVRNVTIALESAQRELEVLVEQAEERAQQHAPMLRDVVSACSAAADAGRDGQRFQPIHASLIQAVLEKLDQAAAALGVPDFDEVDEDIPKPFNPVDLPRYVEALAGLMPGRDLSQFVDTLNLRIKSLLARSRLASVLLSNDTRVMTLEDWLTDYIGADQASNGSVVIIDLSLVPSEVIHIVVSVLARMIFEALQHYRRVTGHELPTVLVLEEAHTFVHRDLSEGKGTPAGQACSRVIERIAREGRKFGLGLVLASQRPSEVSPTVLSQCNTFLLHRIVNDHDQELVKRLVPDGLGALLRELPSLPTGRAVLLGWAPPAPVVVEVRELPNEQRPQSADPAFWGVWVGEEERLIDWKQIAEAWRGDGWKGMQAADKDIPADGESIGVD